MLQLTKHPGETSARTSRRGVATGKRADDSVKHPAFKALVALNVIGACVAAYLYFNRQETPASLQPEPVQVEQISSTPPPENKSKATNAPVRKQVSKTSVPPPEVKQPSQQPVTSSATVEAPVRKEPAPSSTQRLRTNQLPQKEVAKRSVTEPESRSSEITETVSYTVAGPQVYFHNQPDPSTRRNAFINRWNKAVLKPLDEKNGFVYIVYTNQWGQTSKGWMPKNQLKQLN
jgi:eukaryotic-like serine/threonine-protein kinase